MNVASNESPQRQNGSGTLGTILLFGILFVGAISCFLVAWATPYEAWAEHRIHALPPSTWVMCAAVVLFPIGVIDAYRPLIARKFRRETWYAAAIVLALATLVWGYGLTVDETAKNENLRRIVSTGTIGAQIALVLFFALCLCGHGVIGLWNYFRGKKAQNTSARFTLKTIVLLVTFIAIALSIVLSDSRSAREAKTRSLAEAALTCFATYSVAGLISFFIGRHLRSTRHFVRSSFVIFTLPIAAAYTALLLTDEGSTFRNIQAICFHVSWIWIWIALILITWHVVRQLAGIDSQLKTDRWVISRVIGRVCLEFAQWPGSLSLGGLPGYSYAQTRTPILSKFAQ